MSDTRSFVEKWEINGEELVDQGIYEWAAEMLEPYNNILEIGCGTGHSTLTLIILGHKVFSIDKNRDCVRATHSKVDEDWDAEVTNCFEQTDVDSLIMHGNIFNDDTVSGLLDLNIDAIILWNPGQNDDGIKLVDQCISIAKKKDKPIQVLERAKNEKEGEKILEGIASSNAVRLVRSEFRQGQWNHNGIELPEAKGGSIYYALGMFYPR